MQSLGIRHFQAQSLHFCGTRKKGVNKPRRPTAAELVPPPIVDPRQQAFVDAFNQANPELMASTFATIANDVVNTNHAGKPLYAGSTQTLKENLFDERMQYHQAADFRKLLSDMKDSRPRAPFYQNLSIYLQNRDLRICLRVDKNVSIDEHPDDGRFWIQMQPNSPCIEINGEGDYFRENWKKSYSSQWIPMNIGSLQNL